MDWDAFWATVTGFLTGPWGIPLRLAVIVVISILVRVALQFVIRRIVNRVVSGVKRRQNVDDTLALQASDHIPRLLLTHYHKEVATWPEGIGYPLKSGTLIGNPVEAVEGDGQIKLLAEWEGSGIGFDKGEVFDVKVASR